MLLPKHSVYAAAAMHPPSATCSQHELREAVGICVHCRAPMCSDCITKIDGINHCRRCLESLGASRDAQHSSRARRSVPPWLAIACGSTLLSILCWWMIESLMPGGGP